MLRYKLHIIKLIHKNPPARVSSLESIKNSYNVRVSFVYLFTRSFGRESYLAVRSLAALSKLLTASSGRIWHQLESARSLKTLPLTFYFAGKQLRIPTMFTEFTKLIG